jgi:hypothetical protein
MRHLRLALVVGGAIAALAIWSAPAMAAFGNAQNGPLPVSTPFQQCPAVYLDASCGYLIDLTGSGTETIYQDPEVGYYEGNDDVLVGVQNDTNHAISTIHVGVQGSGTGSFQFDGDGLCTPGGGPVPGECPFGPSELDPYDYFGPDAELVATSSDDGNVNFPEPLQPGQYTYFSLESLFSSGSSVLPGGTNDTIYTNLQGPSAGGGRITEPAPVDVTDTAFLKGAHAFEAEVGHKVTYRVFEDSSCSKEITNKGKALGGEPPITEEGVLPASVPFGSGLTTNRVYYVRAEYEGDKKNSPVVENCGDQTLTFGTPPARAGTSVTTTLTGSNGATGGNITVPPGTIVTDSAAVSANGAPQSGRVTYFVFNDPSCTSQVPGVRLGGSTSATGAYGPSAAVVLPLGTYYFQAIYSGNGVAVPARSACGSEVLNVVQPVTPPPVPPCHCINLRAFLNGFSVFGAGSTRLGMRLNVAMLCSNGAGGCRGEVHVLAPNGAKFIDTARHPKGVKGFKPTGVISVACSGPCGATTVQRVPLTWVALETHKHKRGKRTITTTVANPAFLPQNRHSHPQAITLLLVCYGPAGEVTSTSTVKLKIHFDKHGQVDYKTTDANGDGKPDKKQLKEF